MLDAVFKCTLKAYPGDIFWIYFILSFWVFCNANSVSTFPDNNKKNKRGKKLMKLKQLQNQCTKNHFSFSSQQSLGKNPRIVHPMRQRPVEMLAFIFYYEYNIYTYKNLSGSEKYKKKLKVTPRFVR